LESSALAVGINLQALRFEGVPKACGRRAEGESMQPGMRNVNKTAQRAGLAPPTSPPLIISGFIIFDSKIVQGGGGWNTFF